MPAKKTAKKTIARKSASGTSSKKAAATKAPRKSSTQKVAATSGATSRKDSKTSDKSTTRGRRTTGTTSKSNVTIEKVHESKPFAEARSKAEKYANDPKKLGKLFEEAAAKAKNTNKGPFGETWAYFQAMIRLVRAYSNGTYRDIPWASLVLIIVAVIYFVSPFDVIPDFIPVVGFLDDALVVSLALKQVQADLDDFMEWEVSGS